MALGVGATEKAQWKKLPPPIQLSHQRMWLRWWCRTCDDSHSALGSLLL